MLAKPFWLHLVRSGSIRLYVYPDFRFSLFSFEKSRLTVKFTGFTFDWYVKLFHNDDIGLASGQQPYRGCFSGSRFVGHGHDGSSWFDSLAL